MSDDTQPHQTTPDDAMAHALPGVSPAAVLEIMDDPSVAQPLTRGQWLMEFSRMREIMKNPNVPVTQRLQWMDKLEKIGGIVPTHTEGSSGPAFSISINIPQIGAAPAKTITLEAQPPALSATPDADA